MDPILNGHFNQFKKSFEIDTSSGSQDEQIKKNSDAFEEFVNYQVFSADDPDAFTGNIDLLDFVCVGGGNDTGIDGIGIKVNDHLVHNVEEVKTISQTNKKINVEFVFVQSKMGPNVEIAEFYKFGLGVKNFFSKGYLPENPQIAELREIKDFIYSDQLTISKLDTNPVLWLYYITTGQPPKDENFKGTHDILQQELSKANAYFESVNIIALGGKELIKACRELENKFEVQINIIDIFPLIVKLENEVKKAYAFTCSAREYLKLIEKDDGTLRRAYSGANRPP